MGAITETLELDISGALASVGEVETAVNAALGTATLAVDNSAALGAVGEVDTAVTTSTSATLEVDTSDAISQVDKLGQAVTDALTPADGPDASAVFAPVAESAKQSSGTVSTVFGNAISGVTTKMQDMAQTATGAFGSFGPAAAGAVQSIGPVGLAVAALTGFLLSGVKSVQSLAKEITGLQRVSGASAEDASRLAAAFKAVGLSSDSGTAALGKLGREIDIGTSKIGDYGVATVRTAAGNADLYQTFLNVADAVKAAGAGGQATAIAFAAFGKQGLALLPVLSKGRDGLHELFAEADKHHEILSQDDINKANDLSKASRELSSAFHGLAIEASKGLIPALTFIAKGLGVLVEGFDKLGQGIGLLASNLYDGQTVSEALKNTTDELSHGIESATGSTEGFTEATDQSKEAIQAAAQATADEDRAARDLFDAQESLIGNSVSLERAQIRYGEAVTALAKAHRSDLRPALLDVEDAADGVAKAAQASAERLATVEGHSLTAAQSQAVYRNAIIDLKNHLQPGSPAYRALEGFIDLLPPPVDSRSITITVDTTQATAILGQLDQSFANFGANAGGIIAATISGLQKARAAGGNVILNTQVTDPAAAARRAVELLNNTYR